jgi:hypothetical protein
MSTEASKQSTLQAYQQDSSEVLKTFSTGELGLTSLESRKRIAEHGPNRLVLAAIPSSMDLLVIGAA